MTQTRLVDLNSAPRETLEDMPMVGPGRADDLIKARPFKSWEEVAQIPGFDKGMVHNLKTGGAQLVSGTSVRITPRATVIAAIVAVVALGLLFGLV